MQNYIKYSRPKLIYFFVFLSFITFYSPYNTSAQDTRPIKLPIQDKLLNFQVFSYQISLKGVNGKYVAADGGLNGLLVSDRDAIGEWEKFEMFIFEGKKISLRAWNGKYVTPAAEGEHRLYATALKIDEASTFSIGEENGSKATLISPGGKFVAADLGSGGILMANREKAGDWEWFEIVKHATPPKPTVQADDRFFVQQSIPLLRINLNQELSRSQSQFNNATQQKFLQKRQEYFSKPLSRTTPEYDKGPEIKKVTADLAHAQNQIETQNGYFIEGQRFGNEKGTVTIILNEKINGQRAFQCDPQSYWQPNLIAFRVPSIPGLKQVVQGKIVVNHKREDVFPGSFPIRIRPHKVVYQISGKNYFIPAANDRDFMSIKESKDRKFFSVIHDPGCGWIGDHGIDTFNFSNLPKGCKVEKMIFFQSIPNREELAKNWLENHIKEIFLTIAKEGIGGLARYAGKEVLEYLISFIDSDAGKYTAYVMLEPGKNNPIALIRWHNTCWSVYDDIPLIYGVTFFISGPAGLSF